VTQSTRWQCEDWVDVKNRSNNLLVVDIFGLLRIEVPQALNPGVFNIVKIVETQIFGQGIDLSDMSFRWAVKVASAHSNP